MAGAIAGILLTAWDTIPGILHMVLAVGADILTTVGAVITVAAGVATMVAAGDILTVDITVADMDTLIMAAVMEVTTITARM